MAYDHQVADAWPPACACGCGEPVPFGRAKWKPNLYVNQAHINYAQWGKMADRSKKGVETRYAKAIPASQFRAALRRIKKERGYTWEQIADITGLQLGQISCWMNSKKVTRISEKSATHVFRRLAGLATPPTRYEQRDLPKPFTSKRRSPLEDDEREEVTT